MDEILAVQVIMHELGWDVDSNNDIIDQDNYTPILFNGKPIKYPYNISGNMRGYLIFDPLHNSKIMKQLFEHFLKVKNEEDDIYFYIIGNINDYASKKVSLEAKGEVLTVRSGFYKNLLLAYADIMLQLCKAESSDLTKLDE